MDEPIKYSQYTETDKAKLILIHEPSYEIFMSMLHPAGSLYKDLTSESLIQKDFENLKQILKNHEIKIITVREALSYDKKSLIKLAHNSLIYSVDQTENDVSHDTLFKYYLSDEYKEKILNKMSDDQLINIVLTKPFYTLKNSKKNTFIEISNISFKPLGNLIYMRDPQITTQKGIVIGRSESILRDSEKIVIKQVLKNINASIIGEIPENCYLEGGDFFTIRSDMAMLGIGLRSNFETAYYLMKNDLIGCDRLVLCIDTDDLDQERMHLDTFFNLLTERCVLIIDFDDLSKFKGKKINRKIQVYSKNEQEISSKEPINDIYYGEYCLMKEYDDIYKFFDNEGFYFIKASVSQQENFIFNFLNIGQKVIIAINKELKDLIASHRVDVKVIDLEFEAVKNLYGGVRCATQVYRNILSLPKNKIYKNDEEKIGLN